MVKTEYLPDNEVTIDLCSSEGKRIASGTLEDAKLARMVNNTSQTHHFGWAIFKHPKLGTCGEIKATVGKGCDIETPSDIMDPDTAFQIVHIESVT